MDIDFNGMTNAQVAELAFRLNYEQEKYKSMAEDAKKELRSRLDDGKTHDMGKLKVKVSETKRFDADLAEQVLSVTKFKKICVAKPNATLAKTVLTKDEYEKTRKKFENSITVTVKE